MPVDCAAPGIAMRQKGRRELSELSELSILNEEEEPRLPCPSSRASSSEPLWNHPSALSGPGSDAPDAGEPLEAPEAPKAPVAQALGALKGPSPSLPYPRARAASPVARGLALRPWSPPSCGKRPERPERPERPLRRSRLLQASRPFPFCARRRAAPRRAALRRVALCASPSAPLGLGQPPRELEKCSAQCSRLQLLLLLLLRASSCQSAHARDTSGVGVEGYGRVHKNQEQISHPKRDERQSKEKTPPDQREQQSYLLWRDGRAS